MNWLVFSYSLPSKGHSSPRVALWRRLQRLGTVALTGGVYVLPDRAECLEGFQWLAQEVQHAGGEAFVMGVDRFEELTDEQLIDRFHAARREDYRSLAAQAAELLGAGAVADASAAARRSALEELEKLRRRYADLTRVDYFDSPEGAALLARLDKIGQLLAAGPVAEAAVEAAIEPVAPGAFRYRVWVTRPHPHVDRLASVWLIRRFIDPEARVTYRDAVADEEVSFDMPGARFGHVGTRCTFETMLLAFGLSDPALQAVAEIVHEIDLHDGRYARPETAGVEAVLDGWRRLALPDEELEQRGLALFEGLYARFSEEQAATPAEQAEA